MSERGLAEGKTFAEQDMLNILFSQRWGVLPKAYSMQVGVGSEIIPEDQLPKAVLTGGLVALHAKPWELRKFYRGKQHLWNTVLQNANVRQEKEIVKEQNPSMQRTSPSAAGLERKGIDATATRPKESNSPKFDREMYLKKRFEPLRQHHHQPQHIRTANQDTRKTQLGPA